MTNRRLPATLRLVVWSMAVIAGAGCATVTKVPVGTSQVSGPEPSPLRVSPTTRPPAEASRAAANLKVFDAVWNAVDRRYYDAAFNGADWAAAATEYAPQAEAAADEKALYAVINRMLELLHDNHTGAMTPTEVRDKAAEQFVGIGIAVTPLDGQWVVREVYSGAPAEKAGVKPGWVVLTRNGLPWDNPEGRARSAGQSQPWVFLDGADRRVELPLVSKVMPYGRREARLLAGGFGYVRFDTFDQDVAVWLRQELEKLRATPGLVIDLRHNLGGEAKVADRVLGHFLASPDVTHVTITRDERRERFSPVQEGSVHYRGRVVVLVGEFSASAAEVVAAVLQEQGRATIVGETTSGSLLSATLIPLPDGGLLECSLKELITARGRRIEGVGVKPDLPGRVPTLAEMRKGFDPTLEQALNVLGKP